MSRTVLTVNDSKSIRDMVAFTLEAAGYRVLRAENGAEGSGSSRRSRSISSSPTIEDDGRGLDTEAIRARGIARGLIAADAQLPEALIHRLIFEPGFSTAATVSAVSGRGVGMNAVRRGVEALRGPVEIATRPGGGTRITLRLPVTLAIIDGLLVRVGQAIYALPLANVSECVELAAAALAHASGRTMLKVRDRMVPFLDLGGFFNQPGAGGALRRVVIVHAEGRRIGLMVDDILGQNQTVIKTLSPFHRDIGVFSGATILGDGRVALIVDVAHLVKAALARPVEPLQAR